MDKVPDCGNLYICGLDALDDPILLNQAGITHILSVLEFDYCNHPEFDKYKRMLIQAEDHPLQDLYRYFQLTNEFIGSALDPPPVAQGSSAVPTYGNTVVVHCAMGQSRSATVVCAYMIYKLRITASRALQLLQSSRPMCAPNQGFMAQLEQFEEFLGVEGKLAFEHRFQVMPEHSLDTTIAQTLPDDDVASSNASAEAAMIAKECAAAGEVPSRGIHG